MATPVVSMQQLLEAGAHFGHQTHRWNPKMKPYIFTERNGIHIIDLQQTVRYLDEAHNFVADLTARGGKVLFVGTKKQAQDIVQREAQRSQQFFVNRRWLGGTLTNWKTVSHSIQRLNKIEEMLAGEAQGFTKKERLMLDREHAILEALTPEQRDTLAGLLRTLLIPFDSDGAPRS